MKYFLCLFLVFSLMLPSFAALLGKSNTKNYDDLDKDTKDKFQKFKSDYVKPYSSSYNTDIHTAKAFVFAQNLKKIDESNKKNKEFKFGITPFADLTQQQFIDLYLMKINPISAPTITLAATPVVVKDWTNKSGPVRNQGQCGSCWAFSAVGTIQINQRIKKNLGTTKDYSEQQVVDCCRGGIYSSNGCNGGWPSEAMNYLTNAGILLQSSYPIYNGLTNNCRTRVGNPKIINGYLSYSGATSAVNLLQTGSVSVAVDASNWHLYKSGVYSCTTSAINHAVVLVAYDSSRNWKIRNSWGTGWGIAGYMWLKNGNQCGLTRYLYVPKII